MIETIYLFHGLPEKVDPVLAGLFQYDPEKTSGRFRYVKSYLEEQDSLPLSPVDLPALDAVAVPAENRNEGVFGIFRDALPDLWGKLVYSSVNRVPFESVTNIALMRRSDPLRTGALDFSNANEYHTPRHFLDVQDLSRLIVAVQDVLDGDEGKFPKEERNLLV